MHVILLLKTMIEPRNICDPLFAKMVEIMTQYMHTLTILNLLREHGGEISTFHNIDFTYEN